MARYLLHQVIQIGLDSGPFDGRRQARGQPAQLGFFFHQDYLIALFGQTQGGIHTRHTAADHQASLDNRNFLFLQRMKRPGAGHRHTYQILGLFGRFLVPGVDPRILVADVGHFKQVFVQAAGFHGILENRLMGFGTAGGHHHAV